MNDSNKHSQLTNVQNVSDKSEHVPQSNLQIQSAQILQNFFSIRHTEKTPPRDINTHNYDDLFKEMINDTLYLQRF